MNIVTSLIFFGTLSSETLYPNNCSLAISTTASNTRTLVLARSQGLNTSRKLVGLRLYTYTQK